MSASNRPWLRRSVRPHNQRHGPQSGRALLVGVCSRVDVLRAIPSCLAMAAGPIVAVRRLILPATRWSAGRPPASENQHRGRSG